MYGFGDQFHHVPRDIEVFFQLTDRQKMLQLILQLDFRTNDQ